MDFVYRDIVKEPPSGEELAALAVAGCTSVAGLVNPQSTGLKKMGVSRDGLSDQVAADLLMQNPKVMFRPLLTDGDSLVIGFKPEQMEKLVVKKKR